MKPWLKELFLLLADGVELHKHGAILIYDDPEILVANEGCELYCGGDLEEALVIFNAAQQSVERTVSQSSEAVPGVVDEIEELWVGE